MDRILIDVSKINEDTLRDLASTIQTLYSSDRKFSCTYDNHIMVNIEGAVKMSLLSIDCADSNTYSIDWVAVIDTFICMLVGLLPRDGDLDGLSVDISKRSKDINNIKSIIIEKERKDMCLYVNSNDVLVRAVALWRLKNNI